MQVSFSKSALKSSLTMAALLGCSSLVMPSAAEAAIAAKTSWAVSSVASVSQGSYCTMAQKYADATVMTFARNTKGEYSLALDFQDSLFKSGEKQTITLRPQGGAAQTYSVKPQSDKTVVVGIGKDSTIMKQIASTQSLSVEIGGKSLGYTLSEFTTGQKELSNCIEALQGSKDKAADLAQSTKTGMSSPEVKVNKQVAVLRAEGISEPSVEGLLAAKPTPSVGTSALSSDDIDIVSVAPKVSTTTPAPINGSSVEDSRAKEEIVSLREENARLSRAMADQRQSFENRQSAANGAALDELRQKLDAAKSENESLRRQLDSASGKSEIARLNAELTKASQSAQSLQSENQSLKSQLTAQTSVVDKVSSLSVEAQKSSQELAALKAENATLKNQIQVYQSKQVDLSKASSDVQNQFKEQAAELASLQSENAQLKGQIAAASAATGKVQGDTKSAMDKIATLTTELEQQKQAVNVLQSENATLKNQIQIYAKTETVKPTENSQLLALQKENQDLKEQLATASRFQSPAIQESDVEKLRAEFRDLKGQYETAQVQNTVLQDQLSKLQKEKDSSQMKMAGGSWDLEQATRRYQESQREIQRLGAILQTQNAQCTKEKKEIEYMLFDPAIAKSSQVAMLNSMEDQIAEKDKKIKTIEAELATTKAQLHEAPAREQKISELQKQLDAVKADMTAQLQKAGSAQNDVIVSLKNELAKKDRENFEIQSKLADAQNKTMDIEKSKEILASQEKALSALKSELALKEQQLALAQSKAQQVETAQKEISSKDQTLASLQTELAQKAQQLAEAQTKLQQVGQTQSTTVAAQEATIASLKAQLTQAQSQLMAEQVRTQQFDAKASAEQAAALANLQMQVQQGNQKVAELQGQINGMKTASMQAAAVAPAAAAYSLPSPVKAEQAPAISFVTPKSEAPDFMSVDQFASLLKNVGIPVKGSLQQVQGGDPSTYRAYSWKTDSLYGSVEMRQVKNASAFETVIDQYLDRAKSRCSGEFAAVPSQIKARGAEQSKSYEIACVNQSASSSASVLFTYGHGIAMTVAHEGRAEAMDLAMDARDRVSTEIR